MIDIMCLLALRRSGVCIDSLDCEGLMSAQPHVRDSMIVETGYRLTGKYLLGLSYLHFLEHLLSTSTGTGTPAQHKRWDSSTSHRSCATTSTSCVYQMMYVCGRPVRTLRRRA